jgi:recombination protein RecA
MGEKIIGNRVKVKIVKNKVAAPFRTTEFDIMYNEGISLAGDLIDTGTLWNIIKKNGNTYSFGEVKLGVGRENSKLFLKEHPEVFGDIHKELIAAVKAKEIEEAGGVLPTTEAEDVSAPLEDK